MRHPEMPEIHFGMRRITGPNESFLNPGRRAPHQNASVEPIPVSGVGALPGNAAPGPQRAADKCGQVVRASGRLSGRFGRPLPEPDQDSAGKRGQAVDS